MGSIAFLCHIGMPKKKHETQVFLDLINLAAAILIAIGSPVLQALKIYFYFCEQVSNKLINVTKTQASKLKTNRPSAEKLVSLQTIAISEINNLSNRFKTESKVYLSSLKDSKTALFISFKKLEVLWYNKTKNVVPYLKTIKLPTLNIPKFNLPKFAFKNPKRGRIQARPKAKSLNKQEIVWLNVTNQIKHIKNLKLSVFNLPKIDIRLPKLHIPKTPRVAGAAIASISAGIVIFLIFYFSLFIFKDLPHPRLLAATTVPLTTKIYDRNGVLLYQFHGDQNRTLVKLNELPPYVPQAVIAAEDKNFYKHIGFDPAGITRAALANYNGSGGQGGSTITQQLVKFSLLTPERTLTRKIRELVLSLWAERLYTKNEILTMYLNYIGFGGPAYGIEAASEIYFGKPAKNLTLAEASLLASLPSAPTTYSPFGEHPEFAKFRQIQVLDKMAEQGYITKEEAIEAKKQQLTFVPNETQIKAPHFVMYVKDELVKQFGEKKVIEGGLQVTTSLDYELYKKVTDTVKTGVEKQKYLNVQNGAALVTNPKTGEILAMAGSIDFFDLTKDGNVNVTTAERSPGSSIKPLTYALAFENNLVTPNTIIEDQPVEFRQIGGPSYRPTNYDNRFHGRMSIRTALASSYNIPAVKVLDRIGLVNFLQFAVNAGLTTLSDPNRFGLAITLGGGEVKMTDMATAYSMFPNQGTKTPLTSILSVKDSNGNFLAMDPEHLAKSRLISPKSAFFINSILSDDGARSPTFGRGSYLNIPGHTIAVKTGTTETKRDNWTIGYSFGDEPRLVAVWVGNNDNSPMSPALESGNTGAAAIWNPIMTSILSGRTNSAVPQPDDLIAVQICPLTGTLPCENCPGLVTEYFVRGTEPKQQCNLTKEDLEKFKNPDKKD